MVHVVRVGVAVVIAAGHVVSHLNRAGVVSACARAGVHQTTGHLTDHMCGCLGHRGERSVEGVVNLLIARIVMRDNLCVTTMEEWAQQMDKIITQCGQRTTNADIQDRQCD